MRIRIIKTPDGKAPEEIRQCWVGLEMESIGKKEVTDRDILCRDCEGNVSGYQVEGFVAFGALEFHNKAAFDWWREKHPGAINRTLLFNTEACEPVES